MRKRKRGSVRIEYCCGTPGTTVLVNVTAPLTGDMQSDEQPQSLVAYFLQSKKALTHGQTLCSRASMLNAETASIVIEAVAYEAKAQWMNEGVLDQLNVGISFPVILEYFLGLIERIDSLQLPSQRVSACKGRNSWKKLGSVQLSFRST
jgi:hypothetical protein